MSELLPKTCCLNSSENPNALEYQKGHKTRHNNGCGCAGDGSNTDDDSASATKTTVTAKLTRGDFS